MCEEHIVIDRDPAAWAIGLTAASLEFLRLLFLLLSKFLLLFKTDLCKPGYSFGESCAYSAHLLSPQKMQEIW